MSEPLEEITRQQGESLPTRKWRICRGGERDTWSPVSVFSFGAAVAARFQAPAVVGVF